MDERSVPPEPHSASGWCEDIRSPRWGLLRWPYCIEKKAGEARWPFARAPGFVARVQFGSPSDRTVRQHR